MYGSCPGGLFRFETDDDDIYGPAPADDAVHDRCLQNFAPAAPGWFAHHDLGDVVPRGVFHDRIGYIDGGDGCHLASQAFSQAQVAPDMLPVLPNMATVCRCLDVDREPLSLQLFSQTAGGADQLFAVGAAADADQQPFRRRPGPGNGLGLHVGPHLVVHPGGGAAQGQLPQGHQVAGPEKLLDGPGSLLRRCRLCPSCSRCSRSSGGMSTSLISTARSSRRSGTVSRTVDAGDLGHDVVEALEMLDVDRGVDIDAGRQNLLHILPALFVPRTGGVGMGQLVHQDDLRLAGQDGIDIHLRQHDPLYSTCLARQDLQPLQQGVGLGAAMGLDVGRHHVPAVQLPLAAPPPAWHRSCRPRRHSRGRSSACPSFGRASSAWASFQHRLRRGAYVVVIGHHGDSLSNSRLRARTLTRGAPENRAGVLRYLAQRAFSTRLQADSAALATRGTCSRAASGEICGSRPLAEACTSSAGIVAGDAAYRGAP